MADKSRNGKTAEFSDFLFFKPQVYRKFLGVKVRVLHRLYCGFRVRCEHNSVLAEPDRLPEDQLSPASVFLCS